MLTKRNITFLLLVALSVVLLLLFNDSLSDPFVKTPVERGEEIYEQSCIQCHGENGKDRRISTATTLHNQEFLSLATNEFLKETILEGRQGTDMPGFAKKLKEEEIEDVIAYIRSWQDDVIVMETPSEITGDPILGRELYENNCISCHASGVGPEVVNSHFLEQVSDEFLWDTIAYGRSNTAMGPSLEGAGGVRQLSEEDISAIVAYLRSMAE